MYLVVGVGVFAGVFGCMLGWWGLFGVVDGVCKYGCVCVIVGEFVGWFVSCCCLGCWLCLVLCWCVYACVVVVFGGG